MKNARLVFAVFALLGVSTLARALPARADDINIGCDRAHWAGHHDPAAARLAITTQDGKVTLMLTDRDVVFQLSDRTIHKVRRELRDKKEEHEDNWFAYAIVSAVEGTVSDLIDNSVEYRLRDLRDAYYTNGRLVIVGRDGKDSFEDTNVCDSNVMTSFSERDARSFVKEFRKLKGRND